MVIRRDPDPRRYLPLTPIVLQVLLALADGPRHGYGLIGEVALRTDGLIELRTGTLYVLLQRLVEEGVIERASPDPRDPQVPTPGSPRRYYGLTGFGRAVLTAEARRLAAVVGQARRQRILREG
jgi:DNA-binding PadR family transcriptional regulator